MNYKQIDIHANYHDQIPSWSITAQGYKTDPTDPNSSAEPETFHDDSQECDTEGEAVDTIESLAEFYEDQAESVTMFINGNEHIRGSYKKIYYRHKLIIEILTDSRVDFTDMTLAEIAEEMDRGTFLAWSRKIL